MKTEIYWIQAPILGQLGIMARPRGGDWLETEIKQLRHVGLHTFVSLLTYSCATSMGGLFGEPVLRLKGKV